MGGTSRPWWAEAVQGLGYVGNACGSGGFEGLPLDFDDAAFYRRCDSFSKSGRQMREAGHDQGATLLG